jgi:UDP-N-acetylglucosamine--N-acetylmuramyl-(pentapeptide) pyrophosphoryl-undecaprenol N-acetylglucosamine transferase
MKKRFIISGGGTGGHIFPAIAIANKIKKEIPDAEILFIGANDKMEMKLVPDAGYSIVGLNIYGINRSLSIKGILHNLKLPFVLYKSFKKAKKTLREFKPDIAIGVGGYASASALRAAHSLKIPTLIQEQNSYPGITNKFLAGKVNKICVAYDHLEAFFPKEKIVKTGNPVRAEILNIQKKSEEAYEYFGLNPDKPTLMVMGGSLGARTVNQAMIAGLAKLKEAGIQVIWQTGKIYYQDALKAYEPYRCDEIKVTDFLSRMDYAYAVADLVVSRAGASSISELSLLGKPSILVPSPNVAEDHQTHNARALSDKGAAILVRDVEAVDIMVDTALNTISSAEKLQSLSDNVLKLAYPNSAEKIVDEIVKLGK